MLHGPLLIFSGFQGWFSVVWCFLSFIPASIGSPCCNANGRVVLGFAGAVDLFVAVGLSICVAYEAQSFPKPVGQCKSVHSPGPGGFNSTIYEVMGAAAKNSTTMPPLTQCKNMRDTWSYGLAVM